MVMEHDTSSASLCTYHSYSIPSQVGIRAHRPEILGDGSVCLLVASDVNRDGQVQPAIDGVASSSLAQGTGDIERSQPVLPGGGAIRYMLEVITCQCIIAESLPI